MAAVLGDNHLQVEDVGTVPCSGSLSRKHHGRRSKAVHHGYTYEQRRDGRREAAKSFFLGIPLDKDLELSSSTETSTPISQRLPSIQPLAINDTAAMTITSPSIISEFHFQRDLSIESPRRSKRRKSLSQSKRGPHHNVPTQSIISLTKYISDPHDKRVLFTYGGHPVIAYSILPYQKPFKKSEGAGGTGRVRTNSINAHLEIDGIDDFGDPTKETSLVGFLEPLWTAHEQSESPVKKHAVNVLIHQGSFREETPPPPPPTLDSKVYPWNIFRDNHTPEFVLVNYHPDCLDNPEHFFRRHVTTLNLTSYRVSLLKYAKENEVKKEINKQFADVFPHVKLTLSKLKSIKKDMISVGIECGLDPVTIAHSIVYYEKLVLMGKVNKSTRKLIAAAVVILAAKFASDVKRQNIKNLLEETTDKFKISQKELLSYELPVLLALNFSLLTPEHQLKLHTEKIDLLLKHNN